VGGAAAVPLEPVVIPALPEMPNDAMEPHAAALKLTVVAPATLEVSVSPDWAGLPPKVC